MNVTLTPAGRSRVAPVLDCGEIVRSDAFPGSGDTANTALPFLRLSENAKAQLLARCERRAIGRSATVFRQGGLHDLNFIICDGLIRTYYTSATGKEITLFYWSTGDLIGGPNFLSADVLHTWSARAVTECTVWTISPARLETLIDSSFEISRFVIESLTIKVSWLSGLLQGFGTQSVVFRLAHLLVKLADMYGIPREGTVVIRHQFTQEDLANMVGATRQWTSITLQQFRRDGIISTVGGRLHVHNVELLRRIAFEGDRLPPTSRA